MYKRTHTGTYTNADTYRNTHAHAHAHTFPWLQKGQAYHVEYSEDVGGNIAMAMVLHHFSVNHHQGLHIQLFVSVRFQEGALLSGARLVLIGQDVEVILGRLGHVCGGARREKTTANTQSQRHNWSYRNVWKMKAHADQDDSKFKEDLGYVKNLKHSNRIPLIEEPRTAQPL